MAHVALGRIVLWEGGGLWVFHVPALPHSRKRTDFHAHHAIQITLALDGEFELHLRGRSYPGPAVIVPADVSHAFEPKGSIALLFVEPESVAGRALASTQLADRAIAQVPPDLAATFRTAIQDLTGQPAARDSQWRELGQTLIRLLANGAQPPPADRRVLAGLKWAEARLDEQVGIAALAREVGLSPDRMSHLFVEQTGLPFRTYLLWLRMQRAVDAYAQGASLTTAAHDAGFSDSAHFSRTFRRMFGLAAADLQLA